MGKIQEIKEMIYRGCMYVTSHRGVYDLARATEESRMGADGFGDVIGAGRGSA